MPRKARFTRSDLKQLRAAGMSAKEIAKKYGVSEGHIWNKLSEWELTSAQADHSDFFPENWQSELNKTTGEYWYLRELSLFAKGLEYDDIRLESALNWADRHIDAREDMFIVGTGDGSSIEYGQADPNSWFLRGIKDKVLGSITPDE